MISLEDGFAQLRNMIDELRAFTHSRNFPRVVQGGGLRLPHIPLETRFGPFKTTQDFHLWLRQTIQPEDLNDREKDHDWQDVIDTIEKQVPPWPGLHTLRLEPI
ncbi:hypothetical protein M011DRAFT_212528 [Sporormia fimetaria CBS 119925]|uniref:Uncharacterized protein n=1 Tax=Sporormia fimetaria CBS 119925 TaxID=1340428 RepID=A0A6A6V3N3_9PLEO|nr:hypothetical protein M011DRAFT_212528 [Sporormia fimetaria CBS 119925]